MRQLWGAKEHLNDELVEIRNPTVEILEQGESDNEDILEEDVIKILNTWTKYCNSKLLEGFKTDQVFSQRKQHYFDVQF